MMKMFILRLLALIALTTAILSPSSNKASADEQKGPDRKATGVVAGAATLQPGDTKDYGVLRVRLNSITPRTSVQVSIKYDGTLIDQDRLLTVAHPYTFKGGKEDVTIVLDVINGPPWNAVLRVSAF